MKPLSSSSEHSAASTGLAVAHGSQFGLVVIFALYSVIYEAIVWGIFGYAVFWQGRSGWWVLVAVLLSGAQLKPKHFGIRTTDDSSANS